MPFALKLSTTSNLTFVGHIHSNSHPSLPSTASTQRAVVKSALKNYKRLPPQTQASNLTSVVGAVEEYIPYLLALDAGLSGMQISGEEVDATLGTEVEVEWRATLSASTPGRDPARVKVQSLEHEILFVLFTLACAHYLLARKQLYLLYDSSTPTPEQRTLAVTTASNHFLSSNAILSYALARSSQLPTPPSVLDISPNAFIALASLTLAEATLAAVLKDDPYPAAVAQDRNKNDKDWMFKAPGIPKVRVHLFARMCLSAADHASKAQAVLGRTGKADESLVKYLEDLRRTARGKACRFLGIDADGAGQTGEAIAWLRGAKMELGFAAVGKGEQDAKTSGFSKLKKSFAEKREDKKIEKGGSWGNDAGRFEEARVVEMLERKWIKMNDTVNVQLIPPIGPLLGNMPSGREYPTRTYQPPFLDTATLVRMRAPPSPKVYAWGDDSECNSSDEGKLPADPLGAFPGTGAAYAGDSTYY